MLKTIKRFVVTGVIYYFIEHIWCYVYNQHRTPSIIVGIMAGTVCSFIMWLDDWGNNIFWSSFIGGITTMLLELVVGIVALTCFNVRFWNYGTNYFNGIISMKWTLVWIVLCFLLLLVKRAYKIWRRKKKNDYSPES